MAPSSRSFTLLMFWLINFCMGSFYAWSVYATWLSQYYSTQLGATVTVSSLTYIFSVGAALNPVAMIIGGFLTDRLGPRPVLVLGGILASAGYFLMSLSSTPLGLLLGFGLALGLGSGACVIATVTSAVKLFPEKKGFAGGSVAAFYGIGSICLPPLANLLAEHLGISLTLKCFSLLCLTSIALSVIFIKSGRYGLTKVLSNDQDLNWLSMMKTSRFWSMFILFVVVTFSPLMLFSQVVNIARMQVQMTMTSAVMCVSILACANTLGRFSAGVISDRIGRVGTLTISVFLSIVGLGLLSMATVEHQELFIGGLICVGICFGSSVGVFPSYTAEQFGLSHSSLNYGILALAFSVAGLLAPNIIQLTASNGQYQGAYNVALIVSILGLVAAYFCRQLERK